MQIAINLTVTPEELRQLTLALEAEGCRSHELVKEKWLTVSDRAGHLVRHEICFRMLAALGGIGAANNQKDAR